MAVYYNENDLFAAAWLEESIKLKLIAPGEVDTRSIKNVDPIDLKAFTQWHLFAGIGTWSHALRQANWDDERQVLTGSCPCQPFSVSGNQRGFSDERHLWPDMLRLITELRPSAVFGEQVASAESLHWWDAVAGDLEAANYAAAAMDLPAACVGAFHIRSRLFWVANKLANTEETERERRWTPRDWRDGLADSSITRTVANPNGQPTIRGLTSSSRQGNQKDAWSYVAEGSGSPSTFWDDAVWLPCRDGKLRATHPEINPLVGIAGTTKSCTVSLVNGTAARVGHRSDQCIPQVAEVQNTQEARIMRLKGYGNAIVAPLATEFIRSYMER